ncbi:hypothetical protein [Streptosporangium sp. NPDC048865]|uniref:hypothetical protein n=1 Tax=Streptosporangium sp. NPDC048865 TaxID=3155766 RepID=UPI003422C2D1
MGGGAQSGRGIGAWGAPCGGAAWGAPCGGVGPSCTHDGVRGWDSARAGGTRGAESSRARDGACGVESSRAHDGPCGAGSSCVHDACAHDDSWAHAGPSWDHEGSSRIHEGSLGTGSASRGLDRSSGSWESWDPPGRGSRYAG